MGDRVAEIVKGLRGEYRAAANPDQAKVMAAYMRDLFPFLGIPKPERRAATRRALPGRLKLDETQLIELSLACWALPEREYQYFASDQLQGAARRLGPGFIATARHLIVTKSWWDTVDALASHVVGALVMNHPKLAATMDEWIGTDELWLIRTALLHQLRYKEQTDTERLFGYCELQANHPDFFIRKGIGWALREYAKTNPEEVKAFAKRTALSPLSKREALKNLAS